MKLLWLEIIEKIGCSKSVRPSTVIYIIYISRTDFEHIFSQLFRLVVLSRWTFYKKCFFCWDTKKNVIYSKLVSNPGFKAVEIEQQCMNIKRNVHSQKFNRFLENSVLSLINFGFHLRNVNIYLIINKFNFLQDWKFNNMNVTFINKQVKVVTF